MLLFRVYWEYELKIITGVQVVVSVTERKV